MITAFDEFPHQANSDALWRESWYMNFFDHEQQLYGIAWMGIRPNLGTGEILFAVFKGQHCLHKLERFDFPIARDIGYRRMSFGPLRWEVAEPFNVWRLHFDDGTCKAQLEWTAISPLYNWDMSEVAGGAWHYEHPGHITGTITVGDQTSKFDGFGQRDRAWGQRAKGKMNYAVHWFTAQFGADFAIHARPWLGASETRLYGCLMQDGRTEVLERLVLEPKYAYWGGPPVEARIEARDMTGRSTVLTQKIMSVIPMLHASAGTETRMYFTFNRYEADGRVGYGMMDNWWSNPDLCTVARSEYVAPNRGALFPQPLGAGPTLQACQLIGSSSRGHVKGSR